MCSKKTNWYTDVFAESPLMPTAFCLRLQTRKSIDIQTCLQKWPVTLTKFCMGVQTRRSVDIQTCLQNGLLRPLNCVWACRQEGNQSICRRVRRMACYTHYILVGACRQEGNWYAEMFLQCQLSYALCFLCACARMKTNWYAEEFSERPVNPTFFCFVFVWECRRELRTEICRWACRMHC